MSYSVEFFIPIKPIAWERTRSCGKRFFTAPKSAAYKQAIRNHLNKIKGNNKYSHGFSEIFDLPLSISMTFFLPNTKTAKRKFPSVRPDIDNYAKAILDAMNEICFKDDGQVVSLSLEKKYYSPLFGISDLGTKIIISEMK